LFFNEPNCFPIDLVEKGFLKLKLACHRAFLGSHELSYLIRVPIVWYLLSVVGSRIVGWLFGVIKKLWLFFVG
jgi:hypothetical protein